MCISIFLPRFDPRQLRRRRWRGFRDPCTLCNDFLSLFINKNLSIFWARGTLACCAPSEVTLVARDSFARGVRISSIGEYTGVYRREYGKKIGAQRDRLPRAGFRALLPAGPQEGICLGIKGRRLGSIHGLGAFDLHCSLPDIVPGSVVCVGRGGVQRHVI